MHHEEISETYLPQVLSRSVGLSDLHGRHRSRVACKIFMAPTSHTWIWKRQILSLINSERPYHRFELNCEDVWMDSAGNICRSTGTWVWEKSRHLFVGCGILGDYGEERCKYSDWYQPCELFCTCSCSSTLAASCLHHHSLVQSEEEHNKFRTKSAFSLDHVEDKL